MNRTMLVGLIRHLLTFGGGYMVANGSMDQGESEQLVGALCSVIGLLWSAYEKHMARRAMTLASAPQPPTTTPPTSPGS